eukprot:NODE_19_length_47148_cov_1.447810.p17 type:complete len:317 gc:universal NODE_19_length_47148_cov_1.447810:42510-43460(+)
MDRTGIPKKRRKVTKACVYCRRSHLTCDDGRPCQRCIKRGIAGLCKDEPSSKTNNNNNKQPPNQFYPSLQFNAINTQNEANFFGQPGQVDFDVPLFAKPQTTTMASPNIPDLPLINPFESPIAMMQNINPFLPQQVEPANFSQSAKQLNQSQPQPQPNIQIKVPEQTKAMSPLQQSIQLQGSPIVIKSVIPDQTFINTNSKNVKSPEECVEISADPYSALPTLGLRQIIQAKFEAGLLKPFNYAQSYHELLSHMKNFSDKNRSRVLLCISKFRPYFREISGAQNDVDLILVEEKFEKLLIEYDRVLSCMGMPAACW